MGKRQRYGRPSGGVPGPTSRELCRQYPFERRKENPEKPPTDSSRQPSSVWYDFGNRQVSALVHSAPLDPYCTKRSYFLRAAREKCSRQKGCSFVLPTRHGTGCELRNAAFRRVQSEEKQRYFSVQGSAQHGASTVCGNRPYKSWPTPPPHLFKIR